MSTLKIHFCHYYFHVFLLTGSTLPLLQVSRSCHLIASDISVLDLSLTVTSGATVMLGGRGDSRKNKLLCNIIQQKRLNCDLDYLKMTNTHT